ncbi:ABC superfamily ATP binding cassette transporter, ABC protein [Lacticaseibacillus pantheris DSM 15945 = JCM 12539 = NBRC 106106]|uniref:ABC superfamily ATP binding cassette transporter, ABC protein n=1 Tax=Lacticaseibacillus pantheris DSM 15945 = JCM 12539 = NBRC 106106 TaxID=1423783 RepID=A0A0R1TZC4_9LACO|nr:ATP-binding cassette domain-containing protein [Lacticaseibacillus pantheris]KRL84458.1 ABC superfamily ATP binding cassette transporter, ABC protein [Lacticaseibacillus pantheris DSM 15945 = JCM 12539 = NBRC 106106]
MLELSGISKQFGSRNILNGLNLTVPDGQTLAIVGPSGVGKTTLLRIIAGLESADAGTIAWDGQATIPEQLREQGILGVVFQGFELFPQYTVRRNITLAPTLTGATKAAADARANTLMEQLELTDQADAYPYTLSGGQKQRVAIARALALDPQVLLYDEPTSALDPALRDNVAALVNQLKQGGMTQVVVTHDMDFARSVADNVFTMPTGTEA